MSDTNRESAILERFRRLGFELPLDLERLAIVRGCDYYARELSPRATPLPETALSNAELAIALIVPSLSPTPRQIRLAAALLGAPDVAVEEVVSLATREDCADVVSYIAQCGRRFEPKNRFWETLAQRLSNVEYDQNRLPHPTRFVEMTGIDRGKVGVSTRWIRPRMRAAA